MGPLIQELVLKGQARLREQTLFTGATSTAATTLEPAANDVWIIYEIDFEPHDVNLYATITGPNIIDNANLRSLGHPIEAAYLAIPGGPLNVTLNNNTDSGGIVTIRWIQLVSLQFRQLVNPAYHASNAGWLQTLKQVDQLPGHLTEGGHNNG